MALPAVRESRVKNHIMITGFFIIERRIMPRCHIAVVTAWFARVYIKHMSSHKLHTIRLNTRPVATGTKHILTLRINERSRRASGAGNTHIVAIVLFIAAKGRKQIVIV